MSLLFVNNVCKLALPLSLSRMCWNTSRILMGASSRCYSQALEHDPKDEFQLKFLQGNHEGVAVFTLRRFRYRNAMGRNLMEKFIQATQEVKHNNEVRLVIIRSEVPGIFCAGADLKERIVMTEEELKHYSIHTLRYSMTELANLPMPTIAAVDGAALGGGLEMALACDLRVVTDSAKIGLVETSLAIIPGAGGTQRLPRVIGPTKAKELMFTSRVINGTQAQEMGIFNHAVKQNDNGDAAYQKALDLAEEILPRGPIALRMVKAAINRGMGVDIDSGLKYEELYYNQLIRTKDRVEGLKAFQEKRQPQYKGH